MENADLNYNFHEIFDYIKKDKENNILISIILPMYNEEKTIREILESLPKNKSIEIIVVDDHSTDSSVKEVEEAKKYRDIALFKHKKNIGYGGALLTGIQHAKGKVVVTMDSDGQHRPEDISNLIKPILDGEADYTIGSRYIGSYYYDLPVTTRLGEAIVEKLILLFFRQKVMNNQNGFRAFNRKLLPLFKDVKYQGYAFATELILKAAINGYKIKECPIKLLNRKHGSSKIVLRKLTINLFSCLFQYYIKKFKMIFFRKCVDLSR